MEDVPYFNAPIYFANKQQIGKIDEIFGVYSNYFVSIKLSPDIKAKSFKEFDKVKLFIVKFIQLFFNLFLIRNNFFFFITVIY